MVGEIRVQGLVLSSQPSGDYDRRLVLLTGERGKITVFAKGARRPASAFSACTQGFTFGIFTLFEGREAYNLKSVEKTRFFEELRSDAEGTCYGMYFCELAGFFSREGMEETALMKLLYLSLSALAKQVIDRRLVRAVFELRSIAIAGEAMLTEGLFYSARANGMTADAREGSIPVSEAVMETVRYVNTAPLKQLYTFAIPEETLTVLCQISTDYRRRHVDRPMKSLEVLDALL